MQIGILDRGQRAEDGCFSDHLFIMSEGQGKA
jgi:hypothetical protein